MRTSLGRAHSPPTSTHWTARRWGSPGATSTGSARWSRVLARAGTVFQQRTDRLDRSCCLPDSTGVDGRFVYSLRFSAGYAEVTGRIVDSAVLAGYPGAPTGNSIGNLPGSTLAAAALAGGGQLVTHVDPDD